jgi:hypothetical protein
VGVHECLLELNVKSASIRKYALFAKMAKKRLNDRDLPCGEDNALGIRGLGPNRSGQTKIRASRAKAGK